MPPLLARRLITTYTRPGQIVLAAGTGGSTLAEAAAHTGRVAVLDQATPPRVFPPLGATRAALAVVTLPAVGVDCGTYRRWAGALAPCPGTEDRQTSGARQTGGLLAIVVPAGYGRQALLVGQVIDAATRAGLNYLQHIIAITAQLLDGRLRPVPSPDQAARYTTARGAGLPVHLPVHLDVLVLARSADQNNPAHHTHHSPDTSGPAPHPPPPGRSDRLASTTEGGRHAHAA